MSRTPGLDLLRAVATLLVMLFHAQLAGPISDDNPVATYGWMGVDLFFALSGYLIGGQLFRPIAQGPGDRSGLFLSAPDASHLSCLSCGGGALFCGARLS
jgi:peptidoglycan/LPS O-acetylase OafA/YrhL